MPIYEYVCIECGHELEKLQKISDSPLRECPECDAESLKKKISAPGFRLSGSGWYETDFKSDKQKNLSKGDSDKPGKDTESKPSTAETKSTNSGKEAAA